MSEILTKQENFAIILQENLDASTFTVTLNGGSIASYGQPTINAINSEAIGGLGNPFKTIQYLGLPSGANTIRFTKANDTKPMTVWGGFWWTGNTMIVHNIAHGGHTMKVLYDYRLPGEFKGNGFDAVYFQLTEMNEQGSARSANDSIIHLNNILDVYIKDTPIIVSSCPPMGKVGSGTNFYSTYATPQTQKELNSALKLNLFKRKIHFIDLFKIFETKVISRSGTLMNGDAGVYTTDGQHGNELGVNEWWLSLKKIIKNCPLKD